MLRPTLALLGALSLACMGREPDISVVQIDGSSTVFPITEAVAEEYGKSHQARVTIGVSGTGGGFKKFCNGETDITGASRPISTSEVAQCDAAGVAFIELPIAYDGIAVVVHPDNDWASSITVSELKALWRPEAQAQVTRWSQVRPDWPDREIHLFGPGVDSGTYDYFTKAIVGTEHASRGDYTSSEDDNVLVQGISTDPDALGYFGFAYFTENRDRVKSVAIDDENPRTGAAPVSPTQASITDGTYQPLTRPVFLYVAIPALDTKPAVREFMSFYLAHAAQLATEVGYVGLPDTARGLVKARFEKRVTGTVFSAEDARVGVTVEGVLTR